MHFADGRRCNAFPTPFQPQTTPSGARHGTTSWSTDQARLCDLKTPHTVKTCGKRDLAGDGQRHGDYMQNKDGAGERTSMAVNGKCGAKNFAIACPNRRSPWICRHLSWRYTFRRPKYMCAVDAQKPHVGCHRGTNEIRWGGSGGDVDWAHHCRRHGDRTEGVNFSPR